MLVTNLYSLLIMNVSSTCYTHIPQCSSTPFCQRTRQGQPASLVWIQLLRAGIENNQGPQWWCSMCTKEIRRTQTSVHCTCCNAQMLWSQEQQLVVLHLYRALLPEQIHKASNTTTCPGNCMVDLPIITISLHPQSSQNQHLRTG